MRFVRGFIVAAAIVFLIPEVVSCPGCFSFRCRWRHLGPGWVGEIDAGAQKAGQTINDTKLTQEGNVLHVTTGPAADYWNPANKASWQLHCICHIH